MRGYEHPYWKMDKRISKDELLFLLMRDFENKDSVRRVLKVILDKIEEIETKKQ